MIKQWNDAQTFSNRLVLETPTTDSVVTVPNTNGTVALLESPALTGTPTAPTAAVGTNTTQIATTAFVLANQSGVGIGQTWQDVTGSRALGTTYTNSTGKPIMVNVNNVGTTASIQINLYVNGALITGQRLATGGASCRIGVFSIIPNGATYSITNGGGTEGTLNTWSELR